MAGAIDEPQGWPGGTTERVYDEASTWPVTRSEQRFRGHIVGVRTDWVRMPGEDTAARDVVEHPGSVGILALDDRDRVLLLRQYRHPTGHLLWEPPAGLRDVDGETLLANAKRELVEEAGYRAERWHTLVDLFTSPGMADERVRIFVARSLSEVPPEENGFVGVHEEADMPIEWVPLEEAVAKVLAGHIHNPLAIMGILAVHAARQNDFADLRPPEAPEE